MLEVLNCPLGFLVGSGSELEHFWDEVTAFMLRVEVVHDERV